ncbi:MAG: TonB family protein [Chloroherpetonaceae bacterium]|nr:TonB family protein [bacterium]
MESAGVNLIENMPKYGAVELKGVIRKNTVKGFIITAVISLLLFLLYFGWVKLQAARPEVKKFAPIAKIDIVDLPPTDQATEDAPPPPAEQILNAGPAARAGTPVPVPEAMITPDMQEFATIDVQSRAGSKGGSGIDVGGFAQNIDFTGQNVDVKVKEKEPDPEEFIPVEKEPGVDYKKLQSLVQYPDLARRAGVEGRVVVRVLVDKDGSAKRMFIDASDNELLNDAAITAIKKYGRFTPAIQNDQPIMVWISIPIQFKLR